MPMLCIYLLMDDFEKKITGKLVVGEVGRADGP